MAPEMLKRTKDGKRITYDTKVDWWSYGCLVYEFTTGYSPFRTPEARKMDAQPIKAFNKATLKMEVKFPEDKFDADTKDFCKKLLTRNPKHRLGAKSPEEIMEHPYFKDINWSMVKADLAAPPFVPSKDINAASQDDIGQFSSVQSSQGSGISHVRQ